MAEKTEWRVCEFATSTEKVPITTPGHHGWYWQRVCIIANLIGHQGKCALCPVPAALAKAALCDELAKAIRPGADAHRGDKHETPFQRLIRKYDALEASR